MSNNLSSQFREELPHLWRFAIRLSGNNDSAEELTQKTIVRGLEKQEQYTNNTKLRSWLFSIMHSIWKNELRAKAIRQNVSFHTELVEQQAAEDNKPEERIFLKQVLTKVNELPEAQRSVLLLICVEGYSYEETSDILDIPVGTVMSRLARARIKIGSSFDHKSFTQINA